MAHYISLFVRAVFVENMAIYRSCKYNIFLCCLILQQCFKIFTDRISIQIN